MSTPYDSGRQSAQQRAQPLFSQQAPQYRQQQHQSMGTGESTQPLQNDSEMATTPGKPPAGLPDPQPP
jgi:hypothetical protein